MQDKGMLLTVYSCTSLRQVMSMCPGLAEQQLRSELDKEKKVNKYTTNQQKVDFRTSKVYRVYREVQEQHHIVKPLKRAYIVSYKNYTVQVKQTWTYVAMLSHCCELAICATR